MKISMTITVDVNAVRWDPSKSDREVREDVKAYVHASVSELPAIRESHAEVTIR